MGTLLIVIGCLALFVAGACAAFAWNARRLSRADVLDLRVTGDAGRAPLSGSRSAWWRVRVVGGGERCSSETMTLRDGTTTLQLRADAVDPHPEERRRFACATDPLKDLENAHARELVHGAVGDTAYVAEEYSLEPDTRVAVRAEAGPDGVYTAPSRGPRLFAAARAADVAANARRGSAHMARLAGWVGAAGLVVLVAGFLLR